MPLKITRKNNELIFNGKRYKCLTHSFNMIKIVQTGIDFENSEYLIDVHTNGLVVHLGTEEARNDMLAILDTTIEADSLAADYMVWLTSLIGPKMYTVDYTKPVTTAINMQLDNSCVYEDGTWKV